MALKSNKRGSLLVIVAPLLTAGLMAALWSLDFVRELENVTLDHRFRARAASDPPPHPRIALLGIGDASLRAEGRWEEWSREIHAVFTERLTHRPPKVLAFDFFFSEESRVAPEGDVRFADALAAHLAPITGMNIALNDAGIDSAPPPQEYYLGGKTLPLPRVRGDLDALLGGNTANLPIPRIAESAFTGVVNCPASRIDNMRREIPLVARLGDRVYPSFVLQILIQLEETTPDAVDVVLGEAITLPKKDGGRWIIPIDRRGFMAINYRDTDRFVMSDYILVSELLDAVGAGDAWPAGLPPLTDQIVIVGQAAEGLQDLGPTPYHSLDPLFRVQATALDNILRSDYLRRVPMAPLLGGWLLLAWLTLLPLRRAPVVLEIAIPALVTAAYVGLAFSLFRSHSLSLPLVLPVAGFLLLHTGVIVDRLLAELREKRYIKGVFRSYVSPDVVHQILESGETPKLGGERVEITVLFSDIQGFSTFSEQLAPESLVELMVEYLSEMTDIVIDQGGTLDKYIGDAIDVMFGAPLPLADHAARAVYSAIMMQRKQVELREKWQALGKSELVRGMRTRIGLNSGPAVVGNMGSQRRFNYTMMGDNVNLGARCESGAKAYGVYTMITGDTYEATRAVRDDITYRFLDRIVVKGRTLPVEVYEVIEQTSRIAHATLECIDLYAAATELYLQRDWDGAGRAFTRSAALEPLQPGPDIATNPSLVMADRCRAFQLDPPGDDWNGVHIMSEK
ncbi:MAG: adenylate/guanylate cyclase domain-containing protein [Verrucomicrobiaceae bacterium]|nr:adenylate/guanylate cyclase domain-containing protein [Verrucomicrobiaceae bacterium]